MIKLSVLPFGCCLFLVVTCLAQKSHQRAMPENLEGKYRISFHQQVLEIDPAVGGRITSLTLEGKNFLTGQAVHADYWGSTLWPSPQKAWGGAVSPALDHQPYTVSVQNKVLKLVSQKDPKSGYVFTKEISGNPADTSFTIVYTITNASDQVRQVAPWEVTRVHPGGLAFFPRGTGERWGNLATLAEDQHGITWFAHQVDKIPARHHKFFSDGAEGWVAQVNDRVIFIKKFPDFPANRAAPSEAEVEIYTNADKTYVEIEQQGAYETLQPGASLSWEVRWLLRKLPPHLQAEVGHVALADFVRMLVE